MHSKHISNTPTNTSTNTYIYDKQTDKQIKRMVDALHELHKLALKKKFKPSPPKSFYEFIRRQVEDGYCPMICLNYIEQHSI
jgi:hypothetical protein